MRFDVGEWLTLFNPAVGIPARVMYRGTVGDNAVVVFDGGYQATVPLEYLSRAAPKPAPKPRDNRRWQASARTSRLETARAAYVAAMPGEGGGKGWGWTSNAANAKLLTASQEKRFRAAASRYGWTQVRAWLAAGRKENGVRRRNSERKPRKGSPEHRSYVLGLAAASAEARDNIPAYERAEAGAERLWESARTPALAKRHRDAYLRGKWHGR